MRFATIVFIGAGVWGIVVLAPLYVLLDIGGHRYTPPAAHPQFFYGFVSVAMAWQIAFLVIGSNPIRFRWMMIPAIIEKLGFVATVVVLHGQGRMLPAESLAAIPDAVLAGLFVAAFAKTRRHDPGGG